MATLFKDDDFLCEKCGYVLNGLGPEANCSECGKPAYESHPERRVGNAWQQNVSVRSFLQTMIAMIFFPRSTFDRTRVEYFRGIGFKFGCTLGVSFSFVLLMLIWIILSTVRIPDSDVITMLVIFSILALAVTFVLEILIIIEKLGIRFFGRRRQFRITENNAAAICNYSTAGWVAGVLFTLGLLIAVSQLFFRESFDEMDISLAILSVVLNGFLTGLFGMLWFETLVFIGMRRMKFANPPEAAPPWSIEDALRARGELDTPSTDKSASPPAGERAVEIAEVVREPEALGDDTMGA